MLGEAHFETAVSYSGVAYALEQQVKYAEAEDFHRKALAIVRKMLGEADPRTGNEYNNLAVNLARQGKYAEAEALFRKALAIRQKSLGEAHSDTVATETNLANALERQGKYAEAEALHRKGLAIFQKSLGEAHPRTANSYDSLATTLKGQGKYADAEAFARKALAIRQKSPCEDHPDTATSYDNLANALESQGKHAEAEALHRKALAIRLTSLPEADPAIALSYINLGVTLEKQEKYAEAEALFRKALAGSLKSLGEAHPQTAVSFDNLANTLKHQGKYAEAEALLRKALAIRLKTRGEAGTDTASSYNNLALTLLAQGKYAETEALYRKALAIWLKTLGEAHPSTATTYNNLANILLGLGKHAEAETIYRKVLIIRQKTLGESHPDTALSYSGLAASLERQGKFVEAVEQWTAAATAFDRSRAARGASGLERSVGSEASPLSALAVALARVGRSREAWARWEADLARGLLDDLSARSLRPLTGGERSRQAELAGQLQVLDEQISPLVGRPGRTRDEDAQLGRLMSQQNDLRGRWVEFQVELDRRYQEYAGKPSSLEDVQKALPGDTALIGWIDRPTAHWACVIRHEGDPIWIPIPASGRDGAWTGDEEELPAKLRSSLAAYRPDWSEAAALARLRLAPLWPHLENVKRLVILPSPEMAGLPIEALVYAQPSGGPQPIISYAPSGSMFARLTVSRPRPPGPPRLLALGDPTFPEPARDTPAPPPPRYGIPIVAVEPNGIAGLFGIQPGDILLEYNGKILGSPADLAVVPAGAGAARIAVKTWRDGEVRAFEIAAGPLGVRLDKSRSAAEFVKARREAMAILISKLGSSGMPRLPGTRREVESIASLFPRDRATLLLGTDATESKLQGLAQSGELKGYRFLHLATHGQANRDVAMHSAIFLAAEPGGPKPSADPAAFESAPDGQVTAEQIVRTWDLDADLVVLSACESALGRQAGGEGYLGFAQALFVKGARSLVLSLWSVEDRATALLMARFYRNVLGRRPGLSKPMAKAEALHEAKEWLRDLTADEVGGEPLAALDRGSGRPLAKDSGAGPREARTPSRPAGVRPYAHPSFWAAFILVGDPD